MIAVSALAIGAVLATPREGQATRATAPVNTGTPTISGTPQELSTLSADHGTWSNSPTMAIDGQAMLPPIVTPSATTIQVHFRVTARQGRPVQGALVLATAVPYPSTRCLPKARPGPTAASPW